ncbi:MAG: HEAT repeat domain-containing protein [Ignavibacteriaceae bacterium]|nr:HEAT repeat domain-containing protein [Ignavibacteriaceae bacterium]
MNNFDLVSQEKVMEKIEVIEELVNKDVDEATTRNLAELLSHEDKGLRNAVTNFLINNSNPLIPELIINHTLSANVELRNLAGEILVKKGLTSVDIILEKLALCENNDNIKFLVDVLGLIGDTKAEDQVLEILSSNEDENVKLACVETLGNLKSEKSLDKILELFEKDEKYRAPVIDAVGKIGSQRALEFITSNLNTDDELLLFIVLECLGEIGDEHTYYELLSRMNEMTGPPVWPLLESIYKLKEKYNLDLPFDERMKKNVLETVLNSEPKYQKIAAHMVTIFDDPEILYACLIIYGTDPELDEILNEKFFDYKSLILTKIHNLIDIQPANLIPLLNITQNLVQSYQSELGELNSFEKHKLTESISKVLNHQDENVRLAAIEALYITNPESIVLFMDSLIEDANVWNRMRLLDLIAEINSPEIITALEKLTNDPDEMVKEKANEIFNQLQYPTKQTDRDK